MFWILDHFASWVFDVFWVINMLYKLLCMIDIVFIMFASSPCLFSLENSCFSTSWYLLDSSLNTSQYLSIPVTSILPILGFFSITLNTTPIYRANFPNLLFARYLLDTFLDKSSFFSQYLSIPSQSIKVTDSIYRHGST